MQRDEIEAAVRGIYERRAMNDPAGVVRYFAGDATYKIAGHAGSDGHVGTYRGDAIPATMVALCERFPATEFAIASLMIEGQRAAVIIHAKLVFAATGEDISTEIAHFWTFQDGKVIDVVEFHDTARVRELVTKAANKVAS